ncbi:uncharacterized protein METZ01_LOCUS181589 [marine metagenome]|uniref:Uncharacterized protein n=1 Tax=marine metagenome TaxID=408172 RepID=A0A382CRJ4_9ZZZZ
MEQEEIIPSNWCIHPIHICGEVGRSNRYGV